MKTVFFFTLIFSAIISQAAEVDQFTRRNEPLEDSSKVINEKANIFLKKAIDEANLKQKNCDEKILYHYMSGYFSNHLKGELTIFVIEDKSVDRRQIDIRDSVFKDWNAWDGLLLGGPFRKSPKLALSPLIRVGDHIIGSDKFEHLFGRGLSYFKYYYLKNKDLLKTIKRGVAQEKFYFGGLKIETGVFSYSDLSANFNGMRFWNHILGKHEDLMGDNLGPYVKCVDNKFVFNKEIDFRNYFDESMDEAINCSKFPTKKTLGKYNQSIKSLAMTCPIDLDLHKKMIEKYGKFSKWIINSTGNGEIDYRREVVE